MKKQLYYIGNSHIDPVWLWRWQDGYAEVLASFRSALDRMKEYDDFKYTSACMAYYRWVQKTDPEMFEEIKARVKEGRWNIVGGWLIQPDCNIPSGESFARHSLISQRYFKENFGVVARTGYNVDSFGHNAGLPKILRASGMNRYVFMRPSETEKAIGADRFLWKSDDGSSVDAFRIHKSYGITIDRFEYLDEIVESVKRDGVARMAFYGVGNHGGGPTVELIDAIKARGDEEAVFATVDEYFDAEKAENLQVVEGELQHHARGCYGANARIKFLNRRCEEGLLAAERLCLMANKLVGYEYPKERIKSAWERLLFNQFHDILAGCSIESAYTDAFYQLGEAMSVAEEASVEAMLAICRKIDTGDDSRSAVKKKEHRYVWEHEKLGTPLVVFNPHFFTVKTTVSMRINAAIITDEDGNEVPSQLTRGEHTNHNGDIYVVTFPVTVPALGYRVYRAFFNGESVVCEKKRIIASDALLENDVLRVEFSRESGEIVQITDKRSGRIVAKGGMRAIVTDETDCDTWAHDKFDLGSECGEFTLKDMKVIECGDVCATLRVTSVYNRSELIRDYTLTADGDELSVRGEVDFREEHRALKLTFPARDKLVCEVPFGSIERKLCEGEEPFGKWFASGNLGVANDCKHGYDSTEDSVRMTILRGAIFADHFGDRDDRCRYLDRGPHKFAYSIFAYGGKADAHRRAAVLNMPLRQIGETFHRGPLPLVFSGFSSDCENVVFTAAKTAEDSDSAVVRLFEAEGKRSKTHVNLLGKQIETDIAPYAVKTVDENGRILDFMEWEDAN